MNRLDMEGENTHRKLALLQEAQAGWAREQAERSRPGRALHPLLLVSGIFLPLVVRLRDWYQTAGAQGHLPNLHID